SLLTSLVEQIPEGYFITDLFFDSKSNLWIGTDNGIGVHDSKELTWIRFSDTLKDNYVLHIAEQDNGNILVGTVNNFHVLQNRTDVTPSLLTEALTGVQTRYILPKGSDYWVGTSRGLYVFNSSLSELHHFNHSQGIISQNIQGLLSLNDSTLFVATSAGMHKVQFDDSYSINTKHFRLNNDYSGAKIHHKAILAVGDVVWFGTDSGVYSYDSSHEPDYQGPELYFSSVSIDYVRDGGLRFQGKLDEHPQQKNIISSSSLKHTENNLTFNFSGIDFASPERLQFSYRLLGSTDERWTPFSSESTISVENLEPGSYTFQVRGKNDLQLTSVLPLSFTFLIDPPFYRTYWFFTLITLFIVGLIYSAERVRLQWLESNKLRDLVEQRTLSLRENLKEREILIQEVHHRTKNNLAVISGLLELQKTRIEDDNVRHSLVQAQGRVQSIALIHEKLYKNDSLSRINFRNYVEDLVKVISRSYNVENKAIDVHLFIEEIEITIDQGIPCGMILNELVSNAYEHAFAGMEKGEISISFRNKAKNIVFEVTDTGKGFPPDFDLSKSSSLGMTLVHTLTKQINGTLDYFNSNGSKFVITFKRDHY
ncbi:MAG: ATP-binding protein, partial [Balneolales bacterium]|nr:ATP-binding protein [Balneolales bacterium]